MNEDKENPITQTTTPIQPTQENNTPQATPTPVQPKSKNLIQIDSARFTDSSVENESIIKKAFLLNIISALLCALLFAGENQAYLGFFIFTFLVSILLVATLIKNPIIQNKKGFIWLLPINLISFSNALFSTNTHYLNIIVVHILFSLMFLKATNTYFIDIFDIRLLLASFRNFAPSIHLSSIFAGKLRTKERKGKNHENIKNIILGLVIAIPFVLFVLILLSVADKNFADLIENGFDYLDISTVIPKIVYFFVATIVFFIYSSNIIFKKDKQASSLIKININDTILSTFLLCLNAIYIIFLFLQAKYFITGGLFALPDGFSYSEYANDGFFATFIVSLMNFAIILFISEFTNIKFNNIIFKLNFILIFASNISLIFTSLVRLYIYINEYGYTVLRQSACLGLILELIIMLLLILKLTVEIKFYKLAMLSVIIVYLIQAYTSNDYVNTYLNVKKFNITTEDLQNNSSLFDTMKFSMQKTGTNHTVKVWINSDSCAFMWDNFEEVMSTYPKYECQDKFGDTEYHRVVDINTFSFNNQTINELRLKNKLNKAKESFNLYNYYKDNN